MLAVHQTQDINTGQKLTNLPALNLHESTADEVDCRTFCFAGSWLVGSALGSTKEDTIWHVFLHLARYTLAYVGSAWPAKHFVYRAVSRVSSTSTGDLQTAYLTQMVYIPGQPPTGILPQPGL